jgi:hypothetical protein
VKKGDRPADPLELIVRRVDDGREFREEVILRIGHTEPVDAKAVERQVDRQFVTFSKNQIQLKALPTFH